MAQILSYENIQIIDGNSYAINVALPTEVYRFYTSGTITLTSNYPITITGTPAIGFNIDIIFDADIICSSFNVTINGTILKVGSSQQTPRGVLRLFYNGASWDFIDFFNKNATVKSLNGSTIIDATVDGVALVDDSVSLNKLDGAPSRGQIIRSGVLGAYEVIPAYSSGTFLGGNGTDVVMQTMSGDATLNGAGVITIANNAVTSGKINTGAVTLAKLETILKTEIITIPVSFESGEQTGYKIYLPYAGTLVGITGIVTKAIANTDAGTITGACNGVNITTGVITCAASDALGTVYSVVPTANNVFAIGQTLNFTTLKTTVGGKVLLSLSIIRA